MDIILFPATERGVANYGRLQANYSFSFASYYNPDKMGFGLLRVLNDDTISGGAYQEVQGALSQGLGRLLAVVENYPEIRSNQNFLELQAQLEGTENRIAVERMRYNDVARQYNTYIRRFPSNIFAGLFGFDRVSLFEATVGADQAPVVEFN